MTSSPFVGPLLQAFFTEHLLVHRQASPQTVAAYRDCFRLLLNYLHTSTGRQPCALRLADLDAPAILSFLDSLEKGRENCARSRNARLAALRSFFRFTVLREPASAAVATRVLAIPRKRTAHRLVGYLTRTEIEAILTAPDQSTWTGRRDYALLLTLYNSGARVSEIVGLQQNQVIFGSSTFLQLHGKGRKERTVPLWQKTACVLRKWFQQLNGFGGDLAFPNARGRRLSRHGVNFLLRRAACHAALTCRSLKDRPVAPHLVRHSTAVHLLQSGVDLAVIALWLGHESVETTHIYLEADLETKQRALGMLEPSGTKLRRFQAEDKLIAFLNTL